MQNQINTSSTGVKVYTSTYTSKETNSKIVQIAEPITNLIVDHSFELMELAPAYQWSVVGSPILNDYYFSDFDYIASKFGFRHVDVNSSNYYVCSALRKKSKEYTISAYMKLKESTQETGIARIKIETYKSDDWVPTKTFNFDFSLSPGDWTRYYDTFVIDDTDVEFAIYVQSTDSRWVSFDGIQLVEGLEPSVYEPENVLMYHIVTSSI